MKTQQPLQSQLSQKDEKIPQSQKYQNEKPPKQFQINVNVIAETSLDNTMTNSLSQQEKIQLVLELKSIHLQWLNIKRIENLQIFQKLSVLYLQHNNIRKIENLECLKNLEYLALNNNYITKVENLKHLTLLQGLNLNNNQIDELNCQEELPKNIQMLSFVGNPVALNANYKKDLIRWLKNLEVLDDVAITPQEKIKAIGMFPQELLDYSAQMNQFYRKREIKRKNLDGGLDLIKGTVGGSSTSSTISQTTPNQKPILLGGNNINEQQALNQIRQKTRKYLNENQTTFQTEVKDVNEEFGEKVKVSKNIRNIKEQEEISRKDRLEEIKMKKLEEIDREIEGIKQAVLNERKKPLQSAVVKEKEVKEVEQKEAVKGEQSK